MNVGIVAVGFSSPQVNADWAARQSYDFELWTDAEQVLAKHYNVLEDWDSDPMRHAYVLNETGQAVLFYQGGVSMGANPAHVLDDLKTLGEGD